MKGEVEFCAMSERTASAQMSAGIGLKNVVAAGLNFVVSYRSVQCCNRKDYVR